MTKIINLYKHSNIPESGTLHRKEEEKLDELKRENARKADIHKLYLRDSNTSHLFKNINQIILLLSKGTALIFTIFLVVISIINYLNHIPIPNRLIMSIPVSATFITDIPNDICKFFKKTPP